jgi:hypothetical protein
MRYGLEKCRRIAPPLNDRTYKPFPSPHDAVPLGGSKVVIKRLVKVELRHVQPNNALLKNSIVHDVFLAENKDWQAHLVGHSWFDVRPWSCQPLPIDRGEQSLLRRRFV